MDPEPTTRPNPEPLDEATLGALVRDVADDWRMPPQRLDDVTWRDRVGRRGLTGRGGWSGSGWRWTRRLAGAASLAVVATVILSLTAVFLTAPRSGPSVGSATATPTPGASATPGASTGPASTPIPKLVRNGDLPSVTSFMIEEGGTSRLVDLRTGDVSLGLFPAEGYPRKVVARPGGGWVCICGTFTAETSQGEGTLRIKLMTADAAGGRGESRDLRTLSGRIGGDAADRPQAVDGQVSVSADGLLAFLGWSRHDPTIGWVSGVDIIDLDSLETIATVDLPEVVPAATLDKVWARIAPSVAVSPSGRRLFVSSDWYVWTDGDVVPTGTDHWTVEWDGTTAGRAVDAGSTSGDTCSQWGAGFVGEAEVYVACFGAIPAIERRDLAGAVLQRTEVPGGGGGEGGGLLMHVVAGQLYLWDPMNLRIQRMDLRTGTLSQGVATRPTAAAPDDDLLAAIGRRIGQAIAPSAAAKFLLQPAMAVSADGTRLYAIGAMLNQGSIGSTGVFVFDAQTLAELDHWDATADFGSIAISADGAFVYAAGGGGRKADGTPSNDMASITVFDATDGSVRLMAGEVGDFDVWFSDSTLR